MNNKVAILVAYFGTLPDCFLAWKESALMNPMLDFYLFTDNKEIETEKNIIVKHMSFTDFADILQSNFDFKIECSQPYKICDYKPSLGDAFKNIVCDYKYWGYCDVDVVFGDISKFVTPEILEKYDKINIDGHISIFKNNEKMNKLYRSHGDYPEYNYEEAYTVADACYFDEYRGMELKLIREKCKVFSDGLKYINVNPKKPVFYDYYGNQIIAIWDKGKLFAIDKNGKRTEIMYIHICKRKMQLDCHDKTLPVVQMSIVPGRIILNDKSEISDLFGYTSGGKLYTYLWLFDRLKSQLKKYSFYKIIQLNIRSKQISKLRGRLLSEAQ